MLVNFKQLDVNCKEQILLNKRVPIAFTTESSAATKMNKDETLKNWGLKFNVQLK